MPTRRARGTGIMCLRHSCRAAKPKPVRSPGFISAPDVEALVCWALRRTDGETAQTGNDIPGRRADIVALATDATIHIVEIKSSVADFRADTKWRDYRANCDRLFFAIPRPCPSKSCHRMRGSFWPTPMAPKFCARRRNIAWPPPPSGRCSCVLRTGRRIGCIA